jgi:hypothetical protein
MAPDVDFDRIGVFGSWERLEGQATSQTVLLIVGQIDGFFDDGQLVVGTSLGRGIVRLLSAFAFSAVRRRGTGRGRIRFLGTILLLGFPAKELMFEFFDFGLEFLVLLFEICLSLSGAFELCPPIACLLPLLVNFRPQGTRMVTSNSNRCRWC